MAVNDEHMLPKQVRKMYQMEDLLQAEQFMLGIIERIIQDMISESAFVTSEAVTVEYLRKLVALIFKLDCTIDEYPDKVTIKIRLHIRSQEQSEPLHMIEKTNGYIPAHLKVLYEYVSKHFLKSTFYVAQPRTDFIRLSYPYAPMDSRLQKEIYMHAAIPVLEYVVLKFPVRGGLK